MKTYTKAELSEVLRKHKLWLGDKDGGEKADLRYADLSYADLSSANLRSADLRYADLSYADLSDANLIYANLIYANLIYANLSSADLRYANLRYANLRDADLRSADLRSAENFYLLPVQDPRGYLFASAMLTPGGWRIIAGCRFFSVEEAREHWGESYAGERWIGDMYLYACDWLEMMTAEKAEAAA